MNCHCAKAGMDHLPCRLLAIVVLICGAAHAHTNESGDDLFTLSLAEILEVEIDVSGQSVLGLDLQQPIITPYPGPNSNLRTPLSVEEVDSGVIEARGFRNVVDAVSTMTGVLSGESPSEPYSFSIRGFDRESVKVLYDGISMGVSVLNMRPLGTNNLQRVEVLKGPVVLSGEGASGGTINIIPKRAQLTPHHIQKFYFSAGSYNSLAASVDTRGPLSDKTAYLLDIDYREMDGWVDRSESHVLNISSSLRWEPSDDLAWTFSYDRFEDQLPGYWGTPLIPASETSDPERVVTSSMDLVIDGRTRFNNYNVADQVIDSDSQWAKISLEWQNSETLDGFATLYSFNADRHWKNAETYVYQNATDSVERDRLLVTHDRDLVGLNAGFSVRHPLFGRATTTTTRFEYSDNQFDREVGFDPVNFFVDTVALLDPQPGSFNAAPIAVRDGYHDAETLALIAESRVQLNDAWLLDLGLRGELIDVAEMRFNFDGSVRRDQGDNFEQLSYRVGLLYGLSDSTSLYGNIARQHDSIQRSFADFGAANLDGYQPPEARQFEIGLKSMYLDDRLEFALALFDIAYESTVNNSGAIVTNEKFSSGVEAAFRYLITDKVKVGGNFAYVDAEFGNYYDTAFAIDASNNTPINVPEDNAGLWFSYDKLFDQPLEIGFNLNYVSEVFSRVSNDIAYRDYTLVNAFAAYTGSKYRVALHGRNLTDEIYVPFSEPFYTSQVLLGPPRTYELSVRFAL